MAKEKTVYTCSECGGTSPKWLGKCPACNAWNTLIESVAESNAPAKNRFASLAKTATVMALGDTQDADVFVFLIPEVIDIGSNDDSTSMNCYV